MQKSFCSIWNSRSSIMPISCSINRGINLNRYGSFKMSIMSLLRNVLSRGRSKDSKKS